jgi:hypothetical protein
LEDIMTTTTTPETSTHIRHDVIGVLDGQAAGALVWWELSGNIYRETLLQPWRDAGLDEAQIPEPVSSREALKRALEEMRERRLMVRPLAGVRGYSLVAEKAEGEKLDYAQQLTVQVDDAGVLVFEPADHPRKVELAQRHLEQQAILSPTDISSMLLRFCEGLLSVPLRSRGGFYFLPPAGVKQFRRAATVLRQVSQHALYEVPAMKSAEAVTAILAAVQHEAETEAEAMVAILDSGEAGARSLRSQSKRCERAETKLAQYEELLGQKLPDLQQKLSFLRARLTEAALVASTDTDS